MCGMIGDDPFCKIELFLFCLLWWSLKNLRGQPDIFVHVEGGDMLEAHFAGAVKVDELVVDAYRRRSGGQTQGEETIVRGLELVDSLLYIVSCIIVIVEMISITVYVKRGGGGVGTDQHRKTPRHSLDEQSVA